MTVGSRLTARESRRVLGDCQAADSHQPGTATQWTPARNTCRSTLLGRSGETVGRVPTCVIRGRTNGSGPTCVIRGRPTRACRTPTRGRQERLRCPTNIVHQPEPYDLKLLTFLTWWPACTIVQVTFSALSIGQAIRFPTTGREAAGNSLLASSLAIGPPFKRDTRARGRAGEFSCLGTFALLLYQRAGPGSPCSLPTERRCSHSQWLWVSAFSYGRP